MNMIGVEFRQGSHVIMFRGALIKFNNTHAPKSCGNPIEDLWEELEHTLAARPSRLTLVPNLTQTLLDEWAKISMDTPSSMGGVIASKGGSTP